ncbi:aminotransferase class I/II-fold pyridoxal phosphate-dependent enzyme, partial [Brachyspira pilosicoli]
MINAIEKYFPKEVKYTKPEGGMFIWVELPKNIKSVELANETIKRNVAISPGDPFYNKKRNVSTFRLSYSNCSVENIDKGMKIIGETIDKMLKSK